MTAVEITAALKVVPVKGKRFAVPGGYGQMTKGYALYHPKLGYLAFDDSPETPYSPAGGEKTLRSILDAGGLTHYDNIVWLTASK